MNLRMIEMKVTLDDRNNGWCSPALDQWYVSFFPCQQNLQECHRQRFPARPVFSTQQKITRGYVRTRTWNPFYRRRTSLPWTNPILQAEGFPSCFNKLRERVTNAFKCVGGVQPRWNLPSTIKVVKLRHKGGWTFVRTRVRSNVACRWWHATESAAFTRKGDVQILQVHTFQVNVSIRENIRVFLPQKILQPF